MKDHYQILGIEHDATAEQIKKAYFLMAKKYHPDSGDESEIRKFHEVATAYKVLSDKETRRAYDLSLGGGGVEEKQVKTESKVAPTHTGKRESYRDDELKEFHQNRYKKAVFRVVFSSLLAGLTGVIISAVMGHFYIWGGLAGGCMGFSFSINQNFNVRSFFKSDKAHKLFRIFTWLLFLGGLGYFVGLMMLEVLF